MMFSPKVRVAGFVGRLSVFARSYLGGRLRTRVELGFLKLHTNSPVSPAVVEVIEPVSMSILHLK